MQRAAPVSAPRARARKQPERLGGRRDGLPVVPALLDGLVDEEEPVGRGRGTGGPRGTAVSGRVSGRCSG